eukprot:TRINITY_DN1212_c0_g1_i3.p1 TRINITY_DN1212_c0_g1~~TRINITY_DN1212_c0_g1_i3.p1  ORF type:complete len:148 (-),score=3.37 TRINITY_DN1212_c0_g1_i3:5-448(-)
MVGNKFNFLVTLALTNILWNVVNGGVGLMAPCCERVKISAEYTGFINSATYSQDDKLGIYIKAGEINNRDFYIKEDSAGTRYLFYRGCTKEWLVGTKMEGTFGRRDLGLRNKVTGELRYRCPDFVKSGWQFLQDEWYDDDTITVECV